MLPPRQRIDLLIRFIELKTVWGDVEENIPIAIPQKDTQPQGLKLTLLPFQLESLHWMKKQETGVWAGGILAVRHYFVLFSLSFLPCCWGS